MTGDLHINRHSTWGMSDEVDVRIDWASLDKAPRDMDGSPRLASPRLASPRHVSLVMSASSATPKSYCLAACQPIRYRSDRPIRMCRYAL